jgi:hypothetical protein
METYRFEDLTPAASIPLLQSEQVTRALIDGQDAIPFTVSTNTIEDLPENLF